MCLVFVLLVSFSCFQLKILFLFSSECYNSQAVRVACVLETLGLVNIKKGPLGRIVHSLFKSCLCLQSVSYNYFISLYFITFLLCSIQFHHDSSVLLYSCTA